MLVYCVALIGSLCAVGSMEISPWHNTNSWNIDETGPMLYQKSSMPVIPKTPEGRQAVFGSLYNILSTFRQNGTPTNIADAIAAALGLLEDLEDLIDDLEEEVSDAEEAASEVTSTTSTTTIEATTMTAETTAPPITTVASTNDTIFRADEGNRRGDYITENFNSGSTNLHKENWYDLSRDLRKSLSIVTSLAESVKEKSSEIRVTVDLLSEMSVLVYRNNSDLIESVETYFPHLLTVVDNSVAKANEALREVEEVRNNLHRFSSASQFRTAEFSIQQYHRVLRESLQHLSATIRALNDVKNKTLRNIDEKFAE